jgi:hypothetical protein
VNYVLQKVDDLSRNLIGVDGAKAIAEAMMREL